MAYNNYFPNSYQPIYPVYQQPQQQQNTNSILWVQGLEGAKAYPVAAGSSVLLMDSENGVFYIKSADQSGMPTMRVFEYAERVSNEEKSADMSQYVTRDELEKRLSELTKKPTKKESKDEQ